jgi:aryl-phospho-beta-D-glucosidase BglC (GH1 family)
LPLFFGGFVSSIFYRQRVQIETCVGESSLRTPFQPREAMVLFCHRYAWSVLFSACLAIHCNGYDDDNAPNRGPNTRGDAALTPEARTTEDANVAEAAAPDVPRDTPSDGSNGRDTSGQDGVGATDRAADAPSLDARNDMPSVDAPSLDAPRPPPDVTSPPDAIADGAPGRDAGGSADAAPPTKPGFLHTEGARIVDSNGNVVRLSGLSWFGLETSNYAPHGLWSRSMDEILDKVASLGYYSLRLPFCSQLFDAGSTPNGIDEAKNPDLRGLTGLQIMDKVIEGAQKRGLRVLLDRHRPDSAGQSSLWYTNAYSEKRWIDDWKMLAQRYAGNPTVIGADLHNEPHAEATWGDGNMATDWRLAAERAGNAILGINPDWLIVVEGIEVTGGNYYWWGGNLRNAGAAPVRLNVAQRLVYSTHDYPSSLHAQSWFSDPAYPANLPGVWDVNWGYLLKQNIAPVFVGEFGTKYQTESDKQWLGSMASYITSNGLSFAFWSLNPNSGDTGGILQNDWLTVEAGKHAVLAPLLAPRIP